MPLLIKQLVDESADNAELSVMNIEPVDWREICDAIPDDCGDPLPVCDEAHPPDPHVWRGFWLGIVSMAALLGLIGLGMLVGRKQNSPPTPILPTNTKGHPRGCPLCAHFVVCCDPSFPGDVKSLP